MLPSAYTARDLGPSTCKCSSKALQTVLPNLGMKQHLQALSRSRQVSLSALERVVGVDRGFGLQPCGHAGLLTTASWPRACIQASGLAADQEGSEQRLSDRALLCAQGYPSALLRASWPPTMLEPRDQGCRNLAALDQPVRCVCVCVC